MRLVAILTVVFSVVLFSFIGCAVQRAEVKPAPTMEFLEGPPTEGELQVCNFSDKAGAVGKCITLKSLARQYQKAKLEEEGHDMSEGEAVDHL